MPVMKKNLTSADKAQLKKLGVILVYVFGSQVEGFATPLSDLDIGVVFKDPKKYEDNTLEAYQVLYRLFSKLFPHVPEVDVVFLQFASIALQAKAALQGQSLYMANPTTHFNYRQEIMRRHADLQPYMERHYAAILNRI